MSDEKWEEAIRTCTPVPPRDCTSDKDSVSKRKPPDRHPHNAGHDRAMEHPRHAALSLTSTGACKHETVIRAEDELCHRNV